MNHGTNKIKQMHYICYANAFFCLFCNVEMAKPFEKSRKYIDFVMYR